MTRYTRNVTAGQGIGLRRLITLLHKLEVKHRVRRIVMYRRVGKDMPYLLEFYT
jgi:aspartyl/asparaginyl-tRNA synthetase